MSTLNKPPCPSWFSGPPAVYEELYLLRKRIYQRAQRDCSSLRRMALFALGVICAVSLLSQYAVAAGEAVGMAPPILFLTLLPLLCGLGIAALHVVEIRCANMADDGLYVVRLQKHLHYFSTSHSTDDGDPIARQLHQDADNLAAALAEQQHVRPALIGYGLRRE